MKVVILAGGFGTRISEESEFRPKPMIEIGGMPILWHIMKEYSHYGFHDFIICAGYKQEIIKKWFGDYFLHTSDVTFDFSNGNKLIIHRQHAEPWKVSVIDTGLNTMTGGRVLRVRDYVDNQPFMLTYGDAVSNVNIPALLDFLRSHGKTATLTTVSLAQQKGVLDVLPDGHIRSFREKSVKDGSVINGGFMVFSQKIFDYLEGDSTVLEREPMQRLAAAGELMSFFHGDFWQCMDTKREKELLEKLWASGAAPWKTWSD